MQIYELLAKVMRDIGSIGKEQNNNAQHYRFRGIDDALNYCGPIFSRHSVVVMHDVEDYERIERLDQVDRTDKGRTSTVTRSVVCVTLKMRVTFYAPDGTSVSCGSRGEALDYNGDKATSKAQAAAFKYAMFFGLVLAVDRVALPECDAAGLPDSDDPRAYTDRQAANASAVPERKPSPPQKRPAFDGAVAKLRTLKTVEALAEATRAINAHAGYTADEKASLLDEADRIAEAIEAEQVAKVPTSAR